MDQRTYETAGTSALKLVQTRDLWLVHDTRQMTARRGVVVRHNRTHRCEPHDHAFLTGVTCLFVVLMCVVLILASELAASRVANAVQDRGLEVVCVEPGDTLWSIACTHAVDGCSAIEIVQWVEERNGLPDSCIFVGQRLEVPRAKRVG